LLLLFHPKDFSHRLGMMSRTLLSLELQGKRVRVQEGLELTPLFLCFNTGDISKVPDYGQLEMGIMFVAGQEGPI
jgi:hypothetical protein